MVVKWPKNDLNDLENGKYVVNKPYTENQWIRAIAWQTKKVVLPSINSVIENYINYIILNNYR